MPRLNEPAILPAPRFARVDRSTNVTFAGVLPLWVSPSLGDQAAKHVQLALERMVKPVRVRAFSSPHAGPAVRIGTPADGEAFRLLATRHRNRLPGRKLGPEGYVLSASPDGIRITAADGAGAFYALQTLRQLLTKRSGAWRAPAAVVADAPAYPFRGVHLSVAPSSFDELERFIREVLPLYKVNTLVLAVNYHLRFKSHPEIRESWVYPRARARTLVRLCRESCIRLIPLVNCLGHQSWRTTRIGALLRAYPEFNESPWTKEPKYCYSWCPSNRKIVSIVNDLLDEVIEAFEADTLHLGMDEVFDLAMCPRCKGKRKAELFAKAVNDLYRHVTKKRKVRMMIWGDRLIDGKKTPYNEMNGARNGTHAALSKIPKDIFINDWHYHLHDSYPSVRRFDRAGFEYVSCSFKKPWATDAFMVYAAHHGGRRYRGHLDTNWDGIEELFENLSKGKAGRNDQADCFRRGMTLSWRGVKGIKPIAKAQEEKYRKNRPTETELY